MLKTLKYIFIGASLLLAPTASHALTGAFVQITTGTLQPGTTNGFYVSSGTSKNFNTDIATVTTRIQINGSMTASSGSTVTFNGSFSYQGVTNGSSASSGRPGERASGILTRAAAISLVNATAKSVSTMTLTAGDWDVTGTACFQPTGTTTWSNTIASINLTPNALSALEGTPGADGSIFVINSFPNTFVPGNDWCMQLPVVQMNPTGSQSVYLVLQSAFGTSTLTGYGHLRATRVR